jgi:hypothetical protein
LGECVSSNNFRTLPKYVTRFFTRFAGKAQNHPSSRSGENTDSKNLPSPMAELTRVHLWEMTFSLVKFNRLGVTFSTILILTIIIVDEVFYPDKN